MCIGAQAHLPGHLLLPTAALGKRAEGEQAGAHRSSTASCVSCGCRRARPRRRAPRCTALATCRPRPRSTSSRTWRAMCGRPAAERRHCLKPSLTFTQRACAVPALAVQQPCLPGMQTGACEHSTAQVFSIEFLCRDITAPSQHMHRRSMLLSVSQPPLGGLAAFQQVLGMWRIVVSDEQVAAGTKAGKACVTRAVWLCVRTMQPPEGRCCAPGGRAARRAHPAADLWLGLQGRGRGVVRCAGRPLRAPCMGVRAALRRWGGRHRQAREGRVSPANYLFALSPLGRLAAGALLSHSTDFLRYICRVILCTDGCLELVQSSSCRQVVKHALTLAATEVDVLSALTSRRSICSCA